MFEPPIGIDQEAYHTLVDDAVIYLEALSQKLIQSYSELESQNVDIQKLGAAAEALIFATEQLKEQKVELEAYRKQLRKDITSELGEENRYRG